MSCQTNCTAEFFIHRGPQNPPVPYQLGKANIRNRWKLTNLSYARITHLENELIAVVPTTPAFNIYGKLVILHTSVDFVEADYSIK